jgi:dihydrofolate synthase/folylpolyglutamate synthase
LTQVSSASALPAVFTRYEDVQDYLFSLKTRGVRFGIDRMRSFSTELGHPELAVPTLHITGTNGKGSTSAMLESILREAGWRTGLYTSPHLVRLGERVQVNRRPLHEAEILAYTNELRPLAEKIGLRGFDEHPTFFEFMSAMAFLQFHRSACDAAIIEVGMGGELDATNVVMPEVAVITSISLDHCEALGDSLEKIACTKGGIIKPGRPVVIGRVPPAAERVLRQLAADRGSQVFSVREHYGDALSSYPATSLEGDYQRWNAATATLAARCLPPRWKLDDALISRALGKVSWPGRWQRSTVGSQAFIFDASHNPEGAEVLDANLRQLVATTGRKPVVITGVMGSTRAEPLLASICHHAREIHLVVPHQARACSFTELEALIPLSFQGRVVRNSIEELFPSVDHCTAGDPEDTVVVTGSIYLLGEVLARLEPQRGPGEGRLQDF